MTLEVETPSVSSDGPLFPRWIYWAGFALALFVMAGLGYSVGQRHSDVHTATVTGYVGDDETSFQLGGQVQGFVLSTVRWTDASGGTHEPGDIPDCLSQSGKNATMRVSWVPVVTPDGEAFDQFFWLDCRATHYVGG